MEKSEKDFLKWIREANWAWKFCIQKKQKSKDKKYTDTFWITIDLDVEVEVLVRDEQTMTVEWQELFCGL